VKMDMNVVF